MVIRTVKTGASQRSAWLAGGKPNPLARLRLFCFPYAGGSALTYRQWQAGLPAEIEVCPVQLPGRGSRLHEARFTSMPPLIEAMAEVLTGYFDKPFAFFGHSMGAIISFELSRYLRRVYGVEPVHLLVSGRRAPQVPDHDPHTYNLPDARFIEELRRLNGTPDEALGDAELMRVMLPLVRSDFELIQTYAYVPEPPLKCPISVFGGLNDGDEGREILRAWVEQTTGSFSLHMLPGDHFFLNTSRPQLLREISQRLYHSGGLFAGAAAVSAP